MAAYIDTHAHLNFPDLSRDLPGVLKRAENRGVNLIICVGTSLETSREAVELASRYPGVYATVGVHPHDVGELQEDYLEKLEELSHFPQVVAVGETGLDYYRMRAPKEKQQQAFREHIRLACKVHKPLVIHCRDAYRDTYSIIVRENASAAGGVMHCFSGDVNFARRVLQLDFYISFAGTVTYPKAHQLRKAARIVPREKLLVETDAPFLAPQEYRGKTNEPSYITATYDSLARARNCSTEELAEDCLENARRLLGVSLPSSD